MNKSAGGKKSKFCPPDLNKTIWRQSHWPEIQTTGGDEASDQFGEISGSEGWLQNCIFHFGLCELNLELALVKCEHAQYWLFPRVSHTCSLTSFALPTVQNPKILSLNDINQTKEANPIWTHSRQSVWKKSQHLRSTYRKFSRDLSHVSWPLTVNAICSAVMEMVQL